MISVLDHIEYLTSVHDCVIVPGLGAFISQYEITKTSEGVATYLNRRITFNPSICHNDGLLANSISRREGIAYEMSNAEIDNYVLSLRSQLNHEGEVPVGRLGYFSLTDERNLQFFAFMSSMSSNEFFGLSAIKLKPLSQIAEGCELKDETQKKGKVITLTRKMMRVVASIIVLIGLTLILSTPVINEYNQDFADFNAFSIKSNSEELRETYIALPVVEEKTSEQVDLIPDGLKNDENWDCQDTPENEIVINSNGNYCLVVASLASMKQAEQYVVENQMSDYEIFKSTSKYRVYIARGTYNEMISLKESKYANSDAWVCRMK